LPKSQSLLHDSRPKAAARIAKTTIKIGLATFFVDSEELASGLNFGMAINLIEGVQHISDKEN
jgi:hypothetical protein